MKTDDLRVIQRILKHLDNEINNPGGIEVFKDFTPNEIYQALAILQRHPDLLKKINDSIKFLQS